MVIPLQDDHSKGSLGRMIFMTQPYLDLVLVEFTFHQHMI